MSDKETQYRPDALSSALDAFQMAQQRRIAPRSSGKDLTIHAQRMNAIQAYREEIVLPRQNIWDAVMRQVVTSPPHVDVEWYGRRMQLKDIYWRFYHLDEQSGLHVQTTIAPGLDFSCSSAAATELVVATKYLEVGPEATVQRKVPDSLLGVAAQRRRFHKILPLEALRSRVAEELPKLTKRLDVLVKAQPIQGELTEQNSQSWGEPLMTVDVQNPCLEELPLPLEVSAAPEPEDTYDYLYNMTCSAGIGKDFQALRAVYDWLQGATPELPKRYLAT